MAINPQEVLARIKQQKEYTAAIQALWESLFPEFSIPDDRQCRVWLKIYTFDQVTKAIEVADCKLHRRGNEPLSAEPTPFTGPMDRSQVIRYASGAMKGMKRAEND